MATGDLYFEFTDRSTEEVERIDVDILLGPGGELTTSRGSITAEATNVGGWTFQPGEGYESQFQAKWDALRQRTGRLSLKSEVEGREDAYLSSIFLPQ